MNEPTAFYCSPSELLLQGLGCLHRGPHPRAEALFLQGSPGGRSSWRSAPNTSHLSPVDPLLQLAQNDLRKHFGIYGRVLRMQIYQPRGRGGRKHKPSLLTGYVSYAEKRDAAKYVLALRIPNSKL